MNQPQNQSYTPIETNTRLKKRVVDLGQQDNKDINQTSSLSLGQVGPSSSYNVQIISREQLVVGKEQPKIQLQLVQVKKEVAIPKKQQKLNTSSYNILEQMKMIIVNVSLWESLSLLSKRDMLHNALSNLSFTNEPSIQKYYKVVLTNNDQENIE